MPETGDEPGGWRRLLSGPNLPVLVVLAGRAVQGAGGGLLAGLGVLTAVPATGVLSRPSPRSG